MDPYNDPIALAAQGGSSASQRHASDWGLGSLLLGLTLLLMVPLIILAGVVAVRELSDLSPLVVTLTDVVAYGFVALAAVAVIFGVVGLISGFVRNQPVGLAAAGLLVSIVALILWVLMFVALMDVRSRHLHQHNQRFHEVDPRFR